MKMVGLLTDLRLALRALARSPGFALVAVVTLTLGIGATTAVFTLVDGVILQPLPYPDPGELVSVSHEARGGEDRLPMSAGLHRLYSDQASSFESMAMHRATVVNLVGDGDPERIQGRSVTPSFFAVLGVTRQVFLGSLALGLLAHMEGRGIKIEQYLGSRRYGAGSRRRRPDILADGNPHLNPAKLKHQRLIASLKIAHLVKDAIIGQALLGVHGLQFA